MENYLGLLVLFVIWLIIGPIIAMAKAAHAAREAEDAVKQLRNLQERLASLEHSIQHVNGREEQSSVVPVSAPAEEVEDEDAGILEILAGREAQSEAGAEVPVWPQPLPPPLPAQGAESAEPLTAQVPARGEGTPKEAFSLERFMGVKLFAWLGGVAMAPVSILLSLFIMLLEVLVAFIQAYIFTLLSAIFIGMYAHPAH